MKLLQFAFKEFFSQWKQQFKIYCIIMLALAVTFSSSLIIMKTMLVANSEILQVLEQKRTYYLNMVPEYTRENCNRTYELVEELIYSSNYPEIESMDRINLIAIEDIEIEENVYISISLEAVLTGTMEGIVEKERPKMVEGKWFPDEGIEENVIILSEADRDFLFPHIGAGDTLELLDNEFLVLGISSNGNSCVPFECVSNLKNFITEIKSVKFKDQLSEKEVERLQLRINEIGNVQNVVTLYELLKTDTFFTYVLYMILIAVVMVFCICNTTSLFRYIAIMKIYDFNIYKICGMKPKQLKWIFYMQIVSIGIISCLIGGVFYQLLIPLQKRFIINVQLSISMVIYIIVVLIGILLMSVRPIINRVAKRPPIDRTFWR